MEKLIKQTQADSTAFDTAYKIHDIKCINPATYFTAEQLEDIRNWGIEEVYIIQDE